MWRFLFGLTLGGALGWLAAATQGVRPGPLDILRRIQRAATECYFATAPGRGIKAERRKVYRKGQLELKAIAAMEEAPIPDELREKVSDLARTSFDQACKDQESYFKEVSAVLRLIGEEVEEREETAA